jgi:hypothetical protein
MILKMRHYLSMVKTEALTSLLLSTHQLAVDILRYVDHAKQLVIRSDRLCRFCMVKVETPEHTLITCTSSDALRALQASFLEKLFSNSPQLQRLMADLSETEFLKALIYSRTSIALLAKYAYDVLQFFYALSVFRLDA